MSTSAIKGKKRYGWWLSIPLLPLLGIAIWHSALPTVTVHYPKEGREELRYVWNVKDRIYRGRMPPGSSVSDNGFIFPNSQFFMEFSWQSQRGRWHCISVTPKWPETHIYLDENGDIETQDESDNDRLKQCEWDLAKP
ncbi:hypothetical protein PS662_05538 [Pseudomonas fluorescens]|uniref:Uncharacterized protein n=1 Tax=Pseudomonas fluorescens TaxID=294 RepID=A0A5E6XKJ3_PSEFL|nr:hypothetical protein PS662_05538 [Pseudomonas fluorescens]